MKLFERPELKVKRFDRISILTESIPAANPSAVDQALADANKIDDTVGAFVVDLG